MNATAHKTAQVALDNKEIAQALFFKHHWSTCQIAKHLGFTETWVIKAIQTT